MYGLCQRAATEKPRSLSPGALPSVAAKPIGSSAPRENDRRRGFVQRLEPEHRQRPPLQRVLCPLAPEPWPGFWVGGVDQTFPLLLFQRFRQGERDRLVVGVEQDQQRVAGHRLAALVDL